MRTVLTLLLISFASYVEGAIVKQVPTANIPDDIVIDWNGTNVFDAWGVVSAWSNRPDVITVTKGNNTVTITPKTPGFASFTYRDAYSQTSVGVVVLEKDNTTYPGFPDYLLVGARSLLGSIDDQNWLGAGGGSGLNTRWSDASDWYMQGGPASWVWTNYNAETGAGAGSFLDNFIRGCKKQGRIPAIVLYCLPAYGAVDSALGDLQDLNDTSYMSQYYNYTVRMIRHSIYYQTKDDNWPVIVINEPDFLGYMIQQVYKGTGYSTMDAFAKSTSFFYKDPYTGTAANYSPKVSAANTLPSPYALGISNEPLGLPNTYTNSLYGFITSIPYLLKKPFLADDNVSTVQVGSNCRIGWKMNLWASPAGGFTANAMSPNNLPYGTGKGICHWTDATSTNTSFSTIIGWLQAEVQAMANAFWSFGIGEGTNYFVIDRYGIDGASEPNQATKQIAAYNPAASSWFWNSDHWNNYLFFIKTAFEQYTSNNSGVLFPCLVWQIPFGHINTSLATAYSGGSYTNLSDAKDSGAFEDSSSTFWFGDSFTPASWPASGGPYTNRLEFFSQNKWGDQVSVSGNTVTWGEHLSKLPESGVLGILFAPGVGRDASTWGVMQSGFGPMDDYWWNDHAQEYFQNPIPDPYHLGSP
ncbi:MAG: hypothetical protein FJZ58_03705 [Chlamydiae bacterium]|nr:hypothetical protein [Chlamydiota bacterium]